MSMSKLQFGILGTANIARKNWKAILDSGNSTVVAVASRDAKKAAQFIAECQANAPMESAPVALGSYEELLARKDIDAIYLPIPTGLRKEWVVRAAKAGKHIVSEKPCARHEFEMREMMDACAKNRVQFMDGVMFVHTQRLARIGEVLAEGKSVGKIRRIDSAFSFCAGPEFFGTNIRTLAGLEPLGCLGDLGWYCIRFSLWAMNWQMPREVTGRILSSHGGAGRDSVPTEFSGELVFDGGVSAGFYCSFITSNQEWANVSGTEGYLRVDDFVLPMSNQEPSFDVCQIRSRKTPNGSLAEANVQRVTVSELADGAPTSQEASQFRNFSNQVLSGKLNESWPDMALKTQIVTSQCFEAARGVNARQP
jgi:predicted dehydrogenase